jgi:hypothetical protein
MSGSGKSENAVSIIIEAGDFQFNDVLEAVDAKSAREAGRAIANFALSQFAPSRRRARSSRTESAAGSRNDSQA